jgi:hypothetical protein
VGHPLIGGRKRGNKNPSVGIVYNKGGDFSDWCQISTLNAKNRPKIVYKKCEFSPSFG